MRDETLHPFRGDRSNLAKRAPARSLCQVGSPQPLTPLLRGMGLSLAGLLGGFVTPTTSFSEFLAMMDDRESIMWAINGRQGDLASPVTFTDSKGVQHDPPCLDLNRTYTWKIPNDYGNHTQVRKFFNDKANVTSVCSARFDRPEWQLQSFAVYGHASAGSRCRVASVGFRWPCHHCFGFQLWHPCCSSIRIPVSAGHPPSCGEWGRSTNSRSP